MYNFSYEFAIILFVFSIYPITKVILQAMNYLERKSNPSNTHTDVSVLIAFFGVGLTLILFMFVVCCFLSSEFANEHLQDWILDSFRSINF